MKTAKLVKANPSRNLALRMEHIGEQPLMTLGKSRFDCPLFCGIVGMTLSSSPCRCGMSLLRSQVRILLPLPFCGGVMNHRRQTIKRLDLDFWQRMVWDGCFGQPVPLDEIASGLRKIEPVFRKPGWYYRRRIQNRGEALHIIGCHIAFSWFENGAEAYTCDNLAQTFEYEMKILNHVPLTPEMRRSIACLMREHKADWKLKDLFHIDWEWWHLRSISRHVDFSFNYHTQEPIIHSRESFEKWMKRTGRSDEEENVPRQTS